jgi:hydrogenase expression/formation protein HypD
MMSPVRHGQERLPARAWLERIRALPLSRNVKIMNVCGGHERSISKAGLRSALPAHIELVPGPGCPVCICPEEDVYEAIQLALHERVTLVAFGDMLRVPVNVPRSEPRSLEQARAAGADVRPIASPAEAVRIAEAAAGRPVVFFAAGFETTTAPVAAMLAEGVPDNLFVLLSGRLTWPAVAMLLDSGKPGFDVLVAPGHVSTVMGPEEWAFVPAKHGIPAAVAGFTPESLLAATWSVLRQWLDGRAELDNCYPDVVRPGGNPVARRFLSTVMEVVDANWRGIGVVPRSGFALRPEYAAHDARTVFTSHADAARKRVGEMPPGCDCARVVLGRIYPNECRLYGRACNPRTPIGPCMVSDEGACRIWWASGVRDNVSSGRPRTQERAAGVV